MLLKLYNKEHEAIDALTNIKDLRIEYLLSGEDLFEFSLSVSDEKLGLVEEEGYIRTKYNEYVIKAIDPAQSLKRYSCVVNIEDIKGKSISSFDTSNNNITDSIRLAIAGTGWILADNNITKRRTVRLKNTNALEVLREIRKVFRVDFRFDAINKIIHVYEQFGEDKGVYFSDELNLIDLSIPSDTFDYATRLIPIGKDGLDISSINGGKKYVENFQYTNKVIEVIWEDGRYTDVNSLKADAEAKLEELSKPKRSYQSKVSDLAKYNKEYEFLDFFLGDTITLLSKQEKFRDKQRIVKYTEYPKEPHRNTAELGNTTLNFEELQKENEYKNQVVNNITSDNGTLDGSKVDSIKTEQISDFKASVAEITDLTAINIKVSNLEAQNVTITGKLNAIEGEFGTIKANVGVIDKLTVTHTAQINELEANKASITQLEAVSANIGTLEATVGKIETLVNGNLSSENIQAGGITSDKLTISNGFIKNAMIDSLDVSKINAGIISTEKFQIRSNDGSMEFIGSTQQFKDKNNKVRIQLGKDAQGNFNFIIRGEDGTTTLIDHTGIKEKAIANDLIKNNMIAQDAVGEKQINYSSFATGFNKDTNTSTIKSTKIHLNNQNQSLEVAFNSLKTQADGTKSLTESHSTTISTMQGQIKTAINNTQIVKDGQTVLLKDDYNRTVATVNSIKSTIGSHTTTINEHTGKITGVETKVNTVERDLNSITQKVSSTETNVTKVTTTANSALANANSALNKLSINEQTKLNGIEFIDNDYKTDTEVILFNSTVGNEIVPYTDLDSQVTTETNIIKIINGRILYNKSLFLIKNNNPIYVSLEVYNKSTNNGTNYIQAYFYDEDKNVIGNNITVVSAYKLPSSDTWYKLEGFLNIPDDERRKAKYFRFRYINRYNGQSGITYWRNLSIKQLGFDTLTEITKTNNKVSTIETNLSGITQRVSTVEQKQTTVDGKVTELETWKKSAEVKITDSAIVSTVTKSTTYKNDLNGKVSSNSIISSINQTAEAIKIDASKLELNGYVTITNLSSSGQTIINADNIKTGTIESIQIKACNFSGKNMVYIEDDGILSCDGNTYLKHLFIPETHPGWRPGTTGSFSCAPIAWFDKDVHVTNEIYTRGTGVVRRQNGVYIQIDAIGVQNTNDKNWMLINCYQSNHVFGVDLWYSDIKLKENIINIDTDIKVKTINNVKTGLDLIKSINHYSYDYIESLGLGHEHVDCGYIAQQLKELNPGLVREVPQQDGSVLLEPRASMLIPHLSRAIQEQQEEIDRLEKMIQNQQLQINQLRTRVS